GVLHREVHPALIHIALLWHKRVRDALVLDYDRNSDSLTRGQIKGLHPNRRDQVIRTGALLLRLSTLYAEDVYVEDISLQKLHHPFRLLVIVVHLRNHRVRAQPPMTRK